MRIRLPDGSEQQWDGPVTGRQLAESIGSGLAKAAVGVKVDGELRDLDRSISSDAAVEIVTKPKKNTPPHEQDPDALYLVRHSAAHVMAEAIWRLWPDAQLAYGPPVEGGFYYDIRLDEPISSDHFPQIEQKMREIIAEDRPFTRYELSGEQGLEKLSEEGNRYKIENAKQALRAGSSRLSWYVTGTPKKIETNGREYFEIYDCDVAADAIQGNCIPLDSKTHVRENRSLLKRPDWEDLCQGPHVPSTGHIGAFKLTSVAQSHWHGDPDSDAFQRVYGTAFYTQSDLDAYLEQLERARQRDHRVIGQKLGLFTIDEQVGPGLVLWKPNGARVRTILQDFLQNELLHRGYEMVYTPHIGKTDLYRRSGHYPYYADSQFPPIRMAEQGSAPARDQSRGEDGEQYLLKPMNCPHHCRIFASDPHSYRDLPVRMAEFGTVYRYEQSGELSGMTRVRGFTQDDAHIFCTNEQVAEEFRRTVELVQFVFSTFGFEDVSIHLSVRGPETDKYVGDPANWDRAERELREVLDGMSIPYVEDPGEAAFYGPKVDFVIRDVLSRPWQLGTVQLDYNLPERFALEYVGADNRPHRPVMIHRAPFGSLERFMAILIEHYAGAFPLWLAPQQVRVLPISDKYNEYGRKVLSTLQEAGLRAAIDESSERVQAKIKAAQEQKLPYMLIVGGKDEAAGTVSVRERHQGDLGAIPLEQFVEQAKDEVASRGAQAVSV